MKSIKHILILTFLSLATLSVLAQNEEEQNCEQFKKEALTNIKNGNIVYKRFGKPVHLISKEAQDYLIKKYKLHIKQMGCVIEIGEQCYNNEINAYLKDQYGKSAYELIQEAEAKTKKK